MLKPVIIIIITIVLLIPPSVFAPSHPEYVEFEKPLMQIMHGIVPEAVKCNEELVLVLKYSDESPACVKSSTADKLVERRWGTMPPPCCKKLHQEPVSEHQEPDAPTLPSGLETGPTTSH